MLPRAGELAAIGTAACWMFTALSFEAAGKRIGSLTLNQIRMVMAFALLMVFQTFMRGLPLPTDATGHAWLWLSVSGLIGFVFGDYCLFRAFIEVGPRLSALIMSATPVWVLLIGWIGLGETLGWVELGGIALVVAGIGWAVADRHGHGDAGADPGGGGGPTLKGLLWAVGGSLGQAGGLVLSKYGMGDYDAFAATQVRVLAGAIGFAIVCTALGWWPRVREALRDTTAMKYTAVGAVFGPFVGVGLSLLAVQITPNAGVAAALMGTTPILLVPVVWFRGERVGVAGLFGALLAVGGATVLFL